MILDVSKIVVGLNKIVEVLSGSTSFVASQHYVFAENETPSGTINGANAAFVLANTPAVANSLQVFLNGAYQTPGGEDYTLAGDTITFVNAPLTSGVLRVFYKY